jgi:asparagine synthase (glutamine-hydrolysing)
MAFGLELRRPVLDHRVVEFAAKVPADQKVRLRRSRCFLRRAYQGRLPDRILRRHRGGFGPPVGRWFGGDLQAAARDLLLGPSARSYDYLNRDAVVAVLKIDRSGQRNYDALIWTLLVLELWLRGLPSRGGARVAA